MSPIWVSAWLMRGAFARRSRKAEPGRGCPVDAVAAATEPAEAPGPGPPGHMTRTANEVAGRNRRESRTTGSTGGEPEIATMERREASVLPTVGKRMAP